MSTLSAAPPTDPKDLRPLLHAELDRLPDSALEAARALLLEIELQLVAADLDEAADAARESGRLTPQSIANAVAAYRSAHPGRKA